jgi:prepilin-type N-terminal cleavage/methylation domain-containing protein
MRRRETGFTLIEVLVSLTIMAAAFAVLFRIMTAANLGVRSSFEYRTALAIAESKMAELVAGDNSFGEITGSNGKMHWQQRVSVAASLPLSVAANGYAMHRFEVEVAWQTGRKNRAVSLTTLRYRNADQ